MYKLLNYVFIGRSTTMNEKNLKELFPRPAAGKRPGEHDWKPGSDVQSLWKRFGWTPPSQKSRMIVKPVDVKNPPINILRG
jgi:hypothetical protein